MAADHIFQPAGSNLGSIQVQLGCQHGILAEIMNGFSHDPLVVASVFRQKIGAVGLGCIEEGATKRIGFANGSYAVIPIGNFSIAMAVNPMQPMPMGETVISPSFLLFMDISSPLVTNAVCSHCN